jgi:uncharacterized membrane protein (DUF4010 family)
MRAYAVRLLRLRRIEFSVHTAVPMMEYAIFIAMVIVTIGFAWLWLIEQQKKKEKGSASEKRD